MRLLALFLALAFSVNAALAEPALARFDALLQQNNIPIDGVCGSVVAPGTKPADLRIDFKPAATQAQRDQASGLANTFDWLNKTDPNYDKFLDDVFDDTSGNITAAAKRDVSQVALWFAIGKKGRALKLWGLISGTASAPFIRTHATNNQFTLP